MAIDPYSSCPCGSGKSFKWCCQGIYATVEKAREQLESGQQETALRTIDQLIAKNPKSPAALCYKAELLYLTEQFAKADEIIQTVLEIDPNFPLGHWMRGLLRLQEGEAVGALIELRKAAELYDPKAKEYLGRIHAEIFDLEMKFNRPVAGKLALERSIHYNPAEARLRQAFESVFGNQSRLPECARKSYAFRPAPMHRVEAWKALIATTDSSVRLSQAARAFEQLTEQDDKDSAAWFNLGLVRAWLGDHPKAIEALMRSIDLDSDEALTTEASALCEVLKCGEGMQEEGDYAEYEYAYEVKNADRVFEFVNNLVKERRLIGVRVDRERALITGILLDEVAPFSSSVGSAVARTLAYLMVAPGGLRIYHAAEESVDKAADEIDAKLPPAVGPAQSHKSRVDFSDVALEAMAYPTEDTALDPIEHKLRDFARNFFEEIWVQRPFRALSGATPLDAASHPTYRKRLGGLVRFYQDCFDGISPWANEAEKQKKVSLYDFDRLRRKLGLISGVPQAGAGEIDFDTLSVGELAGLSSESWDDDQLGKAFRAAIRLDARDLAGKYSRIAVSRPGVAGVDRFPYFAQLIQLAQAENDYPKIVQLLDDAEKTDREFNEGRHRKDYGLRRGQTLAKQGDADKAAEVFKGLIAEDPNETKYYATATETMLSQKQGQRALEFAEQGLAKARSQNNRDLEGHFLELVEAAKKQVG
jgi:tetratricopeptide (TPR) repeat protein